ncbi:hypothetical protein SAMN05444679_101104 [Variovorax sp. CF079]|nr:hypothetical protein SAMN05444679_101104 [Variovorax sp. CF079]
MGRPGGGRMSKKTHVSETPVEATILDLPKIAINGGRRGYLVGIDPQVCVRLLGAKPVQCALAE